MAKPLQPALGACIIQAEYGYSDEETALQIQENPYLQYFFGYSGYNDEKLLFDPSLMIYFRKRLTPEILGEINEMILKEAQARQNKETAPKSNDDDDNSDDGSGVGGKSGTVSMDAICAPSSIRYPQEVSLLNEARNLKMMAERCRQNLPKQRESQLLQGTRHPAFGSGPRLPQER